MQVQEMYWKQKYNFLEENYNAVKNELKKENSSKTKIGKCRVFYFIFIYSYYS